MYLLEHNLQNQNIDFHYLDVPECLACIEGWISDIHEKVRNKVIIAYDRSPKFCETPWCFYRDGDVTHRADFILTQPAEFVSENINIQGRYIKGFVLVSISKS